MVSSRSTSEPLCHAGSSGRETIPGGGEPAGSGEVSAAEVSAAEVSAAEVAVAEVSAAEVAVAEVSAAEVAVAEVAVARAVAVAPAHVRGEQLTQEEPGEHAGQEAVPAPVCRGEAGV